METTRAKAPFDRRVRRTRAAIKDSFLSLCRTKAPGEITVKEVMSLASVNRATFYAHFANIDELSAAIECDAAQTIVAHCEEALAGHVVSSAAEACDLICDAVLADPDSLAWVAGPAASGCGKDLLREQARAHWGEVSKNEEGLTFDLLFDGCVGLAGQWCENRDQINKDEVKTVICSAAQKLAA